MDTREERKQKRLARKAEIKARRIKRREEREVKRTTRKESWRTLKAEVAKLPAMEDLEVVPYEEDYKRVWPAIDALLAFAIELPITGPKADVKLEEIRDLASRMADQGDVSDEDSNKLVQDLKKYWRWIRSVLELLKFITGDKGDDIIDKIIEIGDWITGEDDED